MSDHPLIAIARDALTAHVHREGYSVPELPAPWDREAGVFVTLTKHGDLRGCIGHLSPTQPSLAAEVAVCAVLAGARDDRFAPVAPNELAELEYEVSILHAPEPATLAQLDARRYGVIVTSGHRRGVLLPDLEGVDSPEQQIAICRRKGGIPADAPVSLERFEVEKVR
ncbi:MAG: AmmeMemoRadiSam system protein A [Alphaproteobacteria bacterium]|nr:AmmeMemoRadiSam system protein A [Alphaproteobacteria bacterium]